MCSPLPSDCGAVTLALPQDVQAEAYDYPEELFRRRVWLIRRGQPDQVSFARAVEAIRASRRPLIVAGGGVLMSEASQALANFASQTGIAVAETQAGKGSLSYDHPQCMGAIGATGTLASNRLAHDADLVIGIGTRYSDFTSASMTAFQNPAVRFVNINTAEFDAYKVSAIPLVADARVALQQLAAALPDYRVDAEYAAQAAGLKEQWEAEVDRLFHLNNPGRPAQSEVIGAMWEASGPRDVLLSAAGSHPGDLHKLWRTRTPNGYHMEYGYSCMAYEIPGAMGAKLADPTREVYVFLGDGTYLMMPTEIVTSVQEGIKIIIVLVDNHGFASIGGLSRSLGTGRLRHQLSLPFQRVGATGWRLPDGGLCRQCAQSGRARHESGHRRRTQGRPGESQDPGPHHRHRGGDRPHGGSARLRILVGCGGRRSFRTRNSAGSADPVRNRAQERAPSSLMAEGTHIL